MPTLMRPISGDDGPRGIFWDLEHKAQFHALYQTLLNAFAERGTLVAVASKNSVDLVHEAFQRPDLAVKPEIFFPLEVHWGPKAESVERILRAWNIGPESVVFVDDNLLELEQIKPHVMSRYLEHLKTTPITRNTRVVVVNHREIPAGLLVDEVLGFRRFAEGEFSGDAPPTVARCERYLAGAFRRGTEQWPVLSLRSVLESSAFSEAAA